MEFFEELQYALENKGPFYTDKDIHAVARIIKCEDDMATLLTIKFEFSGAPGTIFHSAIDTLNERYEYQNDLTNYFKARNSVRLIAELTKLQSRLDQYFDETFLSLIEKDNFPKEGLKYFREHLSHFKTELDEFIRPPNESMQLHVNFLARRKSTYGGYTKWGNHERYTIFIEKCAKLYENLSGLPFKFYIDRNAYNDQFGGGQTDGIRFIRPFHDVLNKIAEECYCKPFSDSAFATTCRNVQKKLKDQRVNQKN